MTAGTRVGIDVLSGRERGLRAVGVMMAAPRTLIGYHDTEESDGHADPSDM
jgi:hypothetical protein